jgi:predicted nucleic acid-binding protein
MMLCDTAPLVAMLDRDDPWHARTVRVLRSMRSAEFITTWPCFTEAMYFLNRAAGFSAQERLWTMLENAQLRLHGTEAGEPARMHGLMKQYADTPMDLADASLVSAAETLGVRQIFTFDQHFLAFKHAGGHFDVVA